MQNPWSFLWFIKQHNIQQNKLWFNVIRKKAFKFSQGFLILFKFQGKEILNNNSHTKPFANFLVCDTLNTGILLRNLRFEEFRTKDSITRVRQLDSYIFLESY